MWYYKNKTITSIDDFPEGCIGFIYMITNITNDKFYIGKKILFFSRKTKISKREKVLTGNNRKKNKIVRKESDWVEYYGSNEDIKKDLLKLGEDSFRREILQFVFTKKQLSYHELRHQILNECLEKDSYNGQILGKYWRKDI